MTRAWGWSCAVMAVLVSSCGASSGDLSSGDADLSEGMCDLRGLPGNDELWTVSVDDEAREFRVHFPPRTSATVALPLVLNFHGYGEFADDHMKYTAMNDKADAEGFIVVYPRGTGKKPSWNAGWCCNNIFKRKDDVQFVSKILDAIEAKACVDKQRIYATGYSNGAMMTQRLACEMADRIAAFAPVSGPLLLKNKECTPGRGVPILEFHGNADETLPLEGTAYGMPAIEDVVEGWAKRGRCQPEAQEIFRNGDASCVSYQGCSDGAEVVFCTIEGGGHTWPGATSVYDPEDGHIATGISANDAMWEFFKKHPLPLATR